MEPNLPQVSLGKLGFLREELQANLSAKTVANVSVRRTTPTTTARAPISDTAELPAPSVKTMQTRFLVVTRVASRQGKSRTRWAKPTNRLFHAKTLLRRQQVARPKGRVVMTTQKRHTRSWY